MTALIERSLQVEIAYRLKRYPVVAVPVPNGLWVPSHNEGERAVVARIINRMKTDGMLVPGSPDLCIAGAKSAIFVELKRSRTRDLLTVRPKGRLSPEQREFRDRCERAGVRYVVAYEWADVERSLGGLW
jgi:VRR-NUC domain